jgi:transcriptional regulator with XRE-family HTH domain
MNTAIPPQHTPSPPRILVGRTFKMMRSAHGVGLRELAALVDISPSHLSRIESGERAPSAELYQRIVDAIAELPAKSA